MVNNKDKEPFEDLSGPQAPPARKETSQQYFKRRNEEMEETRQVFLKEGMKGGAIFTAATSAFVLAGSLISPRFKQTLSWNIRTFIISSGFVAGFWIYGETSSREFIHDRLKQEMDDYNSKK